MKVEMTVEEFITLSDWRTSLEWINQFPDVADALEQLRAEVDASKVRDSDSDVWRARANAHRDAADKWEGRARDLAGRAQGVAIKPDLIKSGNAAHRLAANVAREVEEWDTDA